MLNYITIDQIASITDDLLLIPQINQIEKIQNKLNKCKRQHREIHDNQINMKNDELMFIKQACVNTLYNELFRCI